MVQLSAWLASVAARRAHFATPRRRLLVACGAAAGIASAYNAPIAGALFVAEIVIGTIAMESFGPLIFSSVIATLTVRQLHESSPVFEIPAFELVSPIEIGPYLLLGLLCGIIGVGFLRFLRGSARLFGRRRMPPAFTLGLGGVVVGALSLVRDDIWGNGYSVVSSILDNDWMWRAILAVFVCKVLATAASFGSGAPGGVFTPTLFVGAAVGALFGQAVHALFPAVTADQHAYALVGMGCMLAATTQAPLMAILMLFELTLDYAIILPLMLACVTAYQMAHGLEKRPIYDHGQKRTAVMWPGVPLEDVRVGRLVRPDPPTIDKTARFDAIARMFLLQRHNHLYVIDDERVFQGAIALHDVKSYLSNAQLADVVTAHDLLDTPFPFVTQTAGVAEALQAFSRRDLERLPVVASESDRRLCGSITKTDLLLTLAEATQHTSGLHREK
jgi:CIC family chloride channel protein